jgi:hypothetical protein
LPAFAFDPAPSLRPQKTPLWRSAHEAASTAVTSWTRVTPNMNLGAYEIRVAPTITVEPAWPELNFQELLRIAFRDKLITSTDHEVVRKLRGLA